MHYKGYRIKRAPFKVHIKLEAVSSVLVHASSLPGRLL